MTDSFSSLDTRPGVRRDQQALRTLVCASAALIVTQFAAVARADLACDEYAVKAVQAQLENEIFACGFAGDPWSDNEAGHRAWCEAHDSDSRNQESFARQQALDLCENFCPFYATNAVEQDDAYACSKDGPRWDADFDHHFSWCLAQGAEPAQQEQHARSCAIDFCNHPGQDASVSSARARQSEVRADYTYPVTRERTATMNYSWFPVLPLRGLLDAAWLSAGPDVCSRIETRVGGHSSWKCFPGTSTALFVQATDTPNTVELTYVVSGTNATFNATTDSPLGSYADPEVQLSFDLTLFIRVDFAHTIDPAANDPILQVLSTDACISNASVGSNNVVMRILSDIFQHMTFDQKLEQGQDDLANNMPDTDSLRDTLEAQNVPLRTLVQSLPLQRALNPVFLNVEVDDSDVLLHFSRRGGFANALSDQASSLFEPPSFLDVPPDSSTSVDPNQSGLWGLVP